MGTSKKVINWVISILLIVVIVGWLSSNKENTNLQTKLNTEQHIRDSIEERQVVLEELNYNYNIEINNWDAKGDSLTNIIHSQNSEINRLRSDVKEALNEADFVSFDSSYAYIMTEIPPTDSLSYPLAANQIKEFHKDDIELKKLRPLLPKYDFLRFSYDSLFAVKDSAIVVRDKKIFGLKELYAEEQVKNESLQRSLDAVLVDVKKWKAIGIGGSILGAVAFLKVIF